MIEEDIKKIKDSISEIGIVVCENRDRLDKIEWMLKDIIKHPQDRSNKEKRIKDTIRDDIGIQLRCYSKGCNNVRLPTSSYCEEHRENITR